MDYHAKDKTVLSRTPGCPRQAPVSEIDLSQPRHETTFWWRHNGPVTSQLTNPVKWRYNPLKLIGTMCISTHTTNKTWHIDAVDRQVYICVWCFCIYLYGLSLNGWHAVFCIPNNRHDVTIMTHAMKRHFHIWKTTVRQPTKRRCSCVWTLKYTFICVY